jgi:hypothetical protein
LGYSRPFSTLFHLKTTLEGSKYWDMHHDFLLFELKVRGAFSLSGAVAEVPLKREFLVVLLCDMC